MECPDCDHPLPDGSLSCIHCGSSLDRRGGRRRTEVDEGAPVAGPPEGFRPPPGVPPKPLHRVTALEEDTAPLASPAAGRVDARRTRLDDDEGTPRGESSRAGAPGRARRAAGWMISFDFNSTGQEYVLREGRNRLGSQRDCEISLFYDAFCSAHHATIVYQSGECVIRDEMSSSGTFVNGTKVPIGGTAALTSGDLLRLGHSTFKLFFLSPADLALLIPGAEAHA